MNIGQPSQGIISVIYVVGHLHTGGPTLQLLYLISNLDRTRFKPLVLLTAATGEATQIESRLEQAGVEVIRLKAGKITSMIKAPLRLAKIARREGRVVLHPYGFRSDIISWLSRVGPRLGNVRNNLRYNYQRIFGKRIGALIAALNLFFLRRTDLVVSCGAAVKTDLLSLGQKSIAIRNAIDPAIYRDFMCSDPAAEPATRSLPTYLTVASNIPGKNIEFLVEQFASAPTGLRRLLVIGSADPEFVNSHRHSSNIEFRGHVSKPGDAMLGANFFISASEHEGIPNAVLEALVLGRPVVLSEIPAHLEIMQTVGDDVGATFTWTTDSLNSALEIVERQDFNAMCERSLATAKLNLSAIDMVRRYQIVYDALASQSKDTIEARLKALDNDSRSLSRAV